MCDDPACTEYQDSAGVCRCPSSPDQNGQNLHDLDYTTKHNAVQTAAGERIARQAKALGYKNIRLAYKVPVPQGAKKCANKTTWTQIAGCTANGEADIVLTVETCHEGVCSDTRYVWEVKALGQDINYRAQNEARWYADHLEDKTDPDRLIFARPGWLIGGPYDEVAGFPKTNYWGIVNGAVTYGDNDQPKVKKEIAQLKDIGALQDFAESKDMWKTWRQTLDCGCPAQPVAPGTSPSMPDTWPFKPLIEFPPGIGIPIPFRLGIGAR
jgi:hypothetical protein